MPIELLMSPERSGVRAVRLTARALDLDMKLKKIDMENEENRRAEYTKINPMQTVPTLRDNGVTVIESHAITAWLVNKHGKTDALYPREAKARAAVDELLFFNAGVLYPMLRCFAGPILKGSKTRLRDEEKEMLREAIDTLERLIGDSKWVAGNQMTIADFNCVATVTSINLLIEGIEENKNVKNWLERCRREMPGYKEANQEGLDILEKLYRKNMEGDCKEEDKVDDPAEEEVDEKMEMRMRSTMRE